MGNCFGKKKKQAGINSLPPPLGHGPFLSGFGRLSNDNESLFLYPKVSAESEKSIAVTLIIPRSEEEILASSNLKAFTLSELRMATMNFHPNNLIGEGGFGYVYKGRINENTLGASKPGIGMTVAVKKLKPEGLQGHKEWLSEVNCLGQLRHPNLVKLIGYCLDGKNRLLVYEYLAEGSLEKHLFYREPQLLSWTTRIKVAIDAARGLSFLHDSDQQIIYRDFKASNILLDSDFNAKLSDFGLAKAGPTAGHTHVSTQVMGTQGYAAPEYIATGRLTSKCDVYSFGVVLLELLTGRRALDKTKRGVEQNLVEWARPFLGEKRKLFRIMDTKLEGQYPQRRAFKVALLALNCIGEAKLRPRMTEVLNALEELTAPPKHGTHSSRTQERRVTSPIFASSSNNCHPTSPIYMTAKGSFSPSRSLVPLLKFPEYQ